MHARTAIRLNARRARALGRYVRRRPHEPDFAYFAGDRFRRGLFLDVGANLGHSALSIRTVLPRATILSLEPNPMHERDLRWVAYLVGDMTYHLVAASDGAGEFQLCIPYRGGAPVTGEASLDLDELVRTYGPQNIEQVQVRAATVDSLGVAPAWMKIDVEGHADAVLRGAEQTIRASRPTVMVESDGRTNAWTLAWFDALGYTPHVWNPAGAALMAFRDDLWPQNIIFLPGAQTSGEPAAG